MVNVVTWDLLFQYTLVLIGPAAAIITIYNNKK